MTVSFSQTFVNYRAADDWLETNGYDEPTLDIKPDGSVVVTLNGQHAIRAIEAATRTKVIQEVRT